MLKEVKEGYTLKMLEAILNNSEHLHYKIFMEQKNIRHFVDDTVATLGFYIQSMGATDFPVLDAHCLVIVFHKNGSTSRFWRWFSWISETGPHASNTVHTCTIRTFALVLCNTLPPASSKGIRWTCQGYEMQQILSEAFPKSQCLA